MKLAEDRPDCAGSVVTVPEFTKGCLEANEILIASRENWKLDVINLINIHRPMLNKGIYSYAEQADMAMACSKTIAR